MAPLKKIYEEKMLPIERRYQFEKFGYPPKSPSDFTTKPIVLLLGQYSTGKTTFIEYLLQSKFPGSHIGPEPTTDRFVAVMHGASEGITQGNALVIQSDKPFRGLEKFGAEFLARFQSAELPSPVLEHLTLIDTPGVLSGEKQRVGRGYDYPKVCGWFAERADLILLLFDSHNVDISDEFKAVIESLKGHKEKIRIVLNKADSVESPQLLRVYGALMWSLGKVIQNPEVIRVYIGSFWEREYNHKEFEQVFQEGERDLFRELEQRIGTNTKIGEIVKRARSLKIHALIINHLKEQLPLLWGQKEKQKEILSQLPEEILKVQRKYGIAESDLPTNLEAYEEILRNRDLSSFPMVSSSISAEVDEILEHLGKMIKREAGGPQQILSFKPKKIVSRL